MRKYPILLHLFITLLLLSACASEGNPGGGPPDKTAPFVIQQNINDGATKIAPDQALIFSFSEKLNSSQIDKNITLFPLQENAINIHYKNKNIIITPSKSWADNTIYTLIFEKGLSDLRANTLREPFQFTFTTGNFMPKNAIKGHILEIPQNKTAKIFLSRKYLDPELIMSDPEFYTQSDSKGSFSFDHMPKDSFYIAAYIDEDKSNSYKEVFDLPCVPQYPYVIPDTLEQEFLLQALVDNFISGHLLKAESISPFETKLSFSKDLLETVSKNSFNVNKAIPDTLTLNKNELTLYHNEFETDSLKIHIAGITDLLGLSILDTTLIIPNTELEDDYYHFEQFEDLLRIYPHIHSPLLKGDFHSNDTSTITLKNILPGFYRLPENTKAKSGNLILDLKNLDVSDSLETDTLYNFRIELPAKKEYGRVIAFLEKAGNDKLRFLLKDNSNAKYQCSALGQKFVFEKIPPGTYSLSYYYDLNEDNKRNYGSLIPFLSPEFLIVLEEEIDVKARWDTELAEPYEIDIVNK